MAIGGIGGVDIMIHDESCHFENIAVECKKVLVAMELTTQILILHQICGVQGFIGFRCGLNSTEKSVFQTTIKECEKTNITSTKEAKIQLLQNRHSSKIMVRSCLMLETIDIFTCGFDSLTYGMKFLQYKTSKYISAEQCNDSIDSGILKIDGQNIKIAVNGPTHAVYFAKGYSGIDGFCDHQDSIAGKYEYGSIQYHKAVVQKMLDLQFTEKYLDVKGDRIIFDDGLTVKASKGSEFDLVHGTMSWKVNEKRCGDNYEQIYCGAAEIATVGISSRHDMATAFMVDDGNQRVSLIGKGAMNICGHSFQSTNVDNVFVRTIVDYTDISDLPLSNKVTPLNEVEGLINTSNFNTRWELLKLTEKFLDDTCETEKRILELELLEMASSGVSKHMERRLGFKLHAFTLGSAVYVEHCAALEVKVRHTEYCYNDIPIIDAEGQELFADPNTGFIQHDSFKVTCNNRLPVVYNLNGIINCKYGNHEVIQACVTPPRQLDPNKPLSEQRIVSFDDTNTGMYTAKQLKDYRSSMEAINRRTAYLGVEDEINVNPRSNAAKSKYKKFFENAGSAGKRLVLDTLGLDFISWETFQKFAVLILLWKVFGCVVGIAIRFAAAYIRTKNCIYMFLALFSSIFNVIMSPFYDGLHSSQGGGDPKFQPSAPHQDT